MYPVCTGPSLSRKREREGAHPEGMGRVREHHRALSSVKLAEKAEKWNLNA